MQQWIRKLFVERSDLFLKLMDERWARTEELTKGVTKILSDFGITTGNLLDLCCGNGRVSVFMAKRGFRAVGVDLSRAFIEDARKKAEEHGISQQATFLEGDVRKLREVTRGIAEPFDVVVSAWTSIGYSTPEDDLETFRQARELSKERAVLFVVETMHSDHLNLRFCPTSYGEIEDIMLLESRKYDPIASQLKTTWTFYHKHGEDLEFVDRIEWSLHVYSLSELAKLLNVAGWETVAAYGSLSTLQSFSGMTSLNLVAKAR